MIYTLKTNKQQTSNWNSGFKWLYKDCVHELHYIYYTNRTMNVMNYIQPKMLERCLSDMIRVYLLLYAKLFIYVYSTEYDTQRTQYE